MCKISRTPVLRYAETAEKVCEYGPPWAQRHSNGAKLFVDYALIVGNFSGGCVYIVFVANTFHNICNDSFGWTMSVRVYILMVFIPTFFIGQIRHLKYLVPLSGIGNALTISTIGIVLYYIFKEPLVLSDKPLIVSWTKWPIFFT